uniref:Uncharacterized protein n=1 Tax=Parascaris univalens TaxID=6257 RepID=A0A915BP15_PARUN
MSSILEILGDNSDLESDQEETMFHSKQIGEEDVNKDLSQAPMSNLKERKCESGAEREKATVEHRTEGDASDDPPEISTTVLFRFISGAMDGLKRKGKDEKAKALDIVAPTILGLLKVVVQAASRKRDVDVGKLIFEAASKLQNDADGTRDYEYFLLCVDIVTELLNDAWRRSFSPPGFRRMRRVPTREEMLKEAERLRRRNIELQVNSKMHKNERKRRHSASEVNDGFLTRSAEQLKNKEAAEKVRRAGKWSLTNHAQQKVLTQRNHMSPAVDRVQRRCKASFSPPPSKSVLEAMLDRIVALQSESVRSGYRRSDISDVVVIPAKELMDHRSGAFGQVWTNEINNAASTVERSPLLQKNMDLRYGCSSSSEEAVKKNDKADPQFSQSRSIQSQRISSMEPNEGRTCEIASVSTVVPEAGRYGYHPRSQLLHLNEERRATASEGCADIAYVKTRRAEPATKQEKTSCGNNVTADTSAVGKTAERTKKRVKFHEGVVTSVHLYDPDLSPRNDSSHGVVGVDGDAFRNYCTSGSMISTDLGQPMQRDASVFIRREPISEEVGDFYASCGIGLTEESAVKNWLVVDSSLDLLNETPFKKPSKHNQFPSTVITRARFPPLLFKQFHTAMTAVSGKVGSMTVFLAVSRDVALIGQGSARFFFGFLLDFAAHLMQLYKTLCVGQRRRSSNVMYDAVYNDPPFLEAPRVVIINAPKDPDKERERYLRTFNAELEAFVRHEAEVDDHLSAFYERSSRARLRFCLIDWRRICAYVGADTESSSVLALINHLMIHWDVIPPPSLH